MTETAEQFAIAVHGSQRYGDRPYASHLGEVVKVLADAGYGQPYQQAGWLHDTVEDAQVSVATIKSRFGADVAAMVDACTGLGTTRAERNARIYAGIAAYPRAAAVKLADRIANVEAAPAGSRHLERYLSEAEPFAEAVMPHVPTVMWARLEAALRKAM